MKLNQKGFGAVEGLLVVIALTLIVGVGFYVVNANKDKKETTNTSEVIPQSESKPVEKVEYVEFKELGHKIKKSEAPRGISYAEDSQSQAHKSAFNGSTGLFNVSTDEYTNAVKAICGTPTETWFGQISKGTGIYSTEGGRTDRLIRQFDNEYVVMNVPLGTQGCQSAGGEYREDASITKALDNSFNQLKEAFKNAEKL